VEAYLRTEAYSSDESEPMRHRASIGPQTISATRLRSSAAARLLSSGPRLCLQPLADRSSVRITSRRHPGRRETERTCCPASKRWAYLHSRPGSGDEALSSGECLCRTQAYSGVTFAVIREWVGHGSDAMIKHYM